MAKSYIDVRVWRYQFKPLPVGFGWFRIDGHGGGFAAWAWRWKWQRTWD